MRQSPTRLTLKELRPIMEFYHSHLPGWRLFKKSTLVREASPIVQCITLERLSGGDYRPIGYIRVLIAPEDYWGFELSQDLNIKLRQIDRRRHDLVKEQVVDAMRAEFVPKLDSPLIAEDVLTLYEEQALPTGSEAYSLAPLNAYLGNNNRALDWSRRFTELTNKTGLPWDETDHARRAFLDRLETWIERGDASEQLERVLQEERRKWGLDKA